MAKLGITYENWVKGKLELETAISYSTFSGYKHKFTSIELFGIYMPDICLLSISFFVPCLAAILQKNEMRNFATNNLRIFDEIIRNNMYKLTLSINEEIASKAKDFARASGRSLSSLIETYLTELINQPNSTAKEGISKYMGVAQLPKNFDEKAERNAYLKTKHQ